MLGLNTYPNMINYLIELETAVISDVSLNPEDARLSSYRNTEWTIYI